MFAMRSVEKFQSMLNDRPLAKSQFFVRNTKLGKLQFCQKYKVGEVVV